MFKKTFMAIVAVASALVLMTACASTTTEPSADSVTTSETTAEASAKDTRIYIEVDQNKLSKEFSASDLFKDEKSGKYFLGIDVILKAAEKSGSVTITDSTGNKVTIKKDGTVTSDSGKVTILTVDPKTGKAVSDAKEETAENVSKQVKEQATTKTAKETTTTKTSETTKADETTTTKTSETTKAGESTTTKAAETTKTAETAKAADNQPAQTEAPTQAPSNSGGENNGGENSGGGNNNNQPAETQHTHDWVIVTHDAVTHEEPVYETVHHDAVYESVWVVDSEAWVEPAQYAYHDVCDCGFDFTAAGYGQAEIDAHGSAHLLAGESDGFSTMEVLVSPEVYHDAIGHYEDRQVSGAWDEQIQTGTRTVTDQPAWTETVCSICGATK